MSWTITVVSVNSEGGSYFRDVVVPLDVPTNVGILSSIIPLTGAMFRETPATYDLDFHTAPRRQFIVNLDSSVEIEVSSGEKRVLPAGAIFFVEDIRGQGHKSKAVEQKPRKSIFLPVPESFNIDTITKQH